MLKRQIAILLVCALFAGCVPPPVPQVFPLIVDAGIDQTIEDGDRDGLVDVTLIGAAPGATITSWTWSAGSIELGTADTITATLPIGSTQITLTVTDDQGRTGSDTLLVDVTLPQPKTAKIAAKLDASIQLGGTLSPLRILTILDTQALIPGQSVDVQFFSLDRPRVAIIESSGAATLCPVLVTGADETNGQVDVTINRMALGFVALHPILLQLSAGDREAFFVSASSHPNVAFIEATIRTALAQGKSNLSDVSAFPEIYSSIQKVIDDTLAAQKPAPPKLKSGDAASKVKSDCGEVDTAFTFTVEPGASGNAVFVNSSNVFYGVDVKRPDGSHRVELVRPTGGLITFWPPSLTSASTECYSMLQGNHDFTASAYGTSLDLATGRGQATMANSLYAITLTLDLLGVPVILPSNLAEVLTLSAAMATGNGGSLPVWLKDLTVLVTDAADDGVGKLVTKLVDHIQKHWDDISYYIWKAKPGIKTSDFMKKLGSLLGPIGAFLDLQSAAPFVIDTAWAIAEGPLDFCLNNDSGAVTRNCKPLFTAKADFTWSPVTGEIGVPISFDPAPSLVEGAASAYSWIFDDFDGNTVVDASTPSKAIVQHAFTQPGLHRVRLQITGDNRMFEADKYVAVSILPNLGFESNSTQHWTVETHTWQNTTPGSSPLHCAVVGAGNDPIVAAVTTVWSGRHALRVENSGSGYFISSANRIFTVPAAGFNLKFAWAAILEDPNHAAVEQPYFDIKVTNADTAQVLYSVRHYSNEPGVPWGSASGGRWKYTPWQPVELDLHPFAGQRIRVSAIAADCSLGAHGGYVYIDAFEGQ